MSKMIWVAIKRDCDTEQMFSLGVVSALVLQKKRCPFKKILSTYIAHKLQFFL